jgi:hypothetical protein
MTTPKSLVVDAIAAMDLLLLRIQRVTTRGPHPALLALTAILPTTPATTTPRNRFTQFVSTALLVTALITNTMVNASKPL